jgi:hypothetical protein
MCKKFIVSYWYRYYSYIYILTISNVIVYRSDVSMKKGWASPVHTISHKILKPMWFAFWFSTAANRSLVRIDLRDAVTKRYEAIQRMKNENRKTIDSLVRNADSERTVFHEVIKTRLQTMIRTEVVRERLRRRRPPDDVTTERYWSLLRAQENRSVPKAIGKRYANDFVSHLRRVRTALTFAVDGYGFGETLLLQRYDHCDSSHQSLFFSEPRH